LAHTNLSPQRQQKPVKPLMEMSFRLGVAPQTVRAAYRVGDSPLNVITPMMVYLPFVVTVAQRYQKNAILGTIVALMLPYSLVILIAYLLLEHGLESLEYPSPTSSAWQ